ncbi:MAG TPA: hypothetical protein VGB66_14270, partial [Longimicrobium sp.]
NGITGSGRNVFRCRSAQRRGVYFVPNFPSSEPRLLWNSRYGKWPALTSAKRKKPAPLRPLFSRAAPEVQEQLTGTTHAMLKEVYDESTI